MLPPAATCGRALQRQLYTPPDSIWISDEALSNVFQRFCAVSKTTKRYGSFVPGPLESRRRLGKRRMTLQSNAAPSPIFGLTSLWGSFVGEVDRTRWQWEAPTTRDLRPQENSSVLPKWLVEWATAPEAIPNSKTLPKSASSSRQVKAMAMKTFRMEFLAFRTAVKDCKPAEMRLLCDEINHKISQTLSIGLCHEDVFSLITKLVLVDAQEGLLSSEQGSAKCLAMCQAMWNGISSSKVIQFSDLGDKNIARFMAILSYTRMSEGLQALVYDVLSSVSKTQLQVLHSSILRLVHSWVLSWECDDNVQMDGASLKLAEHSVSEATSAVASVETLVKQLERSPLQSFVHDLQKSRRALQIARDVIISSAGVLAERKWVSSSQRRSFKTLAATLGCLSGGSTRTVVHQCSTKILKEVAGKTMDTSLLRMWLSLISQLPNINEKLLLQTWRQFDSYIEQDSATNIILNFWIGRDLFKRPALVKTIFDVVTSQSHRHDLSTLLYVIAGERENCWDKMRLLFRFLDKLGDFETIYRTLDSLNRLKIKIPADIIDETLENMASANNPCLAYKTFQLYQAMRYNGTPLRLEKCPSFIVSMVINPKINSAVIWKSLGIPVYERMPYRFFARHKLPSKSTLSPVFADHITKMATIFAHCEERSQRVAFRNVMQCLFHLRRHNAPITPELTRAMVHAGISRKISSNGWIAKEKAQWLLELVEKVEGTEVAITVDEIVKVWNENVSERVSKRDRALKVF